MSTISGYKIRETLYESNHSLVFRAYRMADNLPVILKTLREEYPLPERIAQFKREYEIAHCLNSGPGAKDALDGVAATYSIDKHHLSFVIVSEDFGGISLDRWMNIVETPLPANGLSTFLPLAIQVTKSLGQIHQRQIIHKDINPSNIIFNKNTAQVKIIDFGISTSLSRENPIFNNPNMLEGTFAYISPEQTGRINRAVDYRTDFYSLGATFYELMTGQVPFPTGDVLELVHCHIAKQPAAPHELKPDIPMAVSDLVLKLLAKDAEDRYQSAHGLLADLEKCLQQWQTAGRIEPFPLGQRDVSDRFQISQKLYGREREIEALLTAFERISAGTAEMMLIVGCAGIGKTALVQEIYKPVTLRRGYFSSGKFDQLHFSIPYSALIQVFSSLIRQLLTESEMAITDWREKLQAALGPNGGVILEVIPEVELIIGPQPAVPALAPIEAQNRFSLLFQNFIRVFTKPAHPLVIFLDDLQWADIASLNLIKILMMIPESKCLFFIGSYRDNDLSPTHPLMQTLEEIKKSGLPVNAITLAPLDLLNVTRMIADTLYCPIDCAMSLAELVLARTGGNPFFLLEFLKNLYNEGLIVFDFQHAGWQWELAQIQAQGITDNVVDLIAGKVQQLHSETQQALKLAACIGNEFDLKILADVHKKSPSETAADLWPALTAGMVLPLNKAYKFAALELEGLADEVIVEYKFAHNRVHQAIYSLISREEVQAIHVQVGRLLLRNASPSERDARIFDIVNQLNQGRELIIDQTFREEMAELNLLAGQKAKSSAAYDTAFSYLHSGIELLRRDGWETQYDLSLTLYVEAAEAAYLSGDFEAMESLAETVLKYTRTLIDEVKVYEIKIQACIAQNKQMEAVQIALSILKLLGVKIPHKPNKLHIVFGLLRTKMALAGKHIDDLICLPAMTDPHKLAAMRILAKIGSATYIASPNLMPLIAFQGINLFIRYGTAAESAFAYVAYGTILCGVTGDIDGGYRFGRLASRMLEQINATRLKTRTLFAFNAFIRHWKESIWETLIPLREGYQSGLENGDLEFAARCIHSYCVRSFFVGRQLEEVERDMTKFSSAVRQLKQESPLRFFEPFHRLVLKLMGGSETSDRIIGENSDEKYSLPQEQVNDQVFTLYTHFCNLLGNYQFEQFSQAIEDANAAERHRGGALASVNEPYLCLYDSLARIAVYGSSSRAEQKRILKKVTVNQKKLSKWAHHAPMNNMHKFTLVAAEHARISGRHVEAGEYYDKAIALAHENEFLNDEALAYELAGKFYLARSQTKIAQGYLHDARYAYLRWGALAKVQDLEARYAEVLAQTMAGPVTVTSRPAITFTTQQHIASAFDLNSVIKASQAISGEIVLNRLVDKLMSILIENAGAQRALLVLEKNGRWLINEEVPVSIINYVSRTLETVVLADASHNGPFTFDPDILARKPKSIICMPLLHQGRLSGILYLENNLTTYAFTPERLEILRLLSGQIAISLTNALLYDELEIRVQKRTAELSKTNILLKQEIADREKAQIELLQAKDAAEEAYRVAEAANHAKSTFLANVSHEIRTPLNAITGLTNLALKTELSDKQHDYLHKICISSQNLFGIISNILDFSKIEAGKLDLDHNEFELGSVMVHLYSMFSDRAAEKGIKLNFSNTGDVPSILVGDPLRLEQILINLINNAIKFTDTGDVTITTYLEKMESQTLRLRFAVNDTGIGIPQDSLMKIFDTFTQLDDSVTRKYGGTGLGLSICKRLVEVMGGELWVESTPGRGSTFYFTADFTRRSDDEQKKKKDVTQPGLIKSIIGARILLVEDNIINQQVAKEILESAGLVVDVANNGQEAVGTIRACDYDAVLMDVQMPVMSGYEATRAIRVDPRYTKLPIIAMTAHAMQGASEECMSSGMNDYVVKPINKGALFSILNRWVKPRLHVRCDEPATVCGEVNIQANDPGLPDTLPGIDIVSGLERLSGNRNLYAKLLKMFSRDYAGMTDEIKAALNRKDTETAERLTHTIRGVAGNLSARDLQRSASELEKGIKQQIPEKLDILLETFEHYLTQVVESVRSFDYTDTERTEHIFEDYGSKIYPDFASRVLKD
jgi:predicted ATPase/signal transduction histidine kinase/CheY-like chemotaxis protein/HPt (histidine-containing phosphotransfer) domain-containing protein